MYNWEHEIWVLELFIIVASLINILFPFCLSPQAGFIRHTVNKITFSEQCYYVFGDLCGSKFSGFSFLLPKKFRQYYKVVQTLDHPEKYYPLDEVNLFLFMSLPPSDNH